jgi:TonB family protein
VCVTGSVVDAKTKKPITNAILILKGESDAIVLNTDMSGNYSFKQVADGSYMLEVSVIGYKKETKKVKVEPNKVATVDFALKEDVVTADEVVVATYADKEKKSKMSKSKGEQEEILVISQQPNENCFHNGEFIGSPRDVEKLSKFLEQYKGNTIKVQLESGCPMISSVLLYMLRNMSMNVIAEYKYDKSSRDQNEAEAGIKEFLSEQLKRRLNNVECMTGVVTVNAKVARTGMVSIENMSVVSTNGVGMALAKRVEQSIKQAPFVNVQGLNESLPLTLEVVFAKKGLDGKVETDVAPEKISADAVWVIGEETSLTVEDIVVVEKSDESFDSSAKNSEEDTPFVKVEKMPTFQGGDFNKFRNWVQSNVKYPQEAQEKALQGRVVFSFVVEKDGSVSEFQALQSPDKVLTDEVERVFKTSPKWEPGEQLGEKVRVKYTVPIVFQIKQ